MRKLIILSTFIITLCFAGAAFGQEEVLTNDEIISLAKAGLSTSIIVDKVRTTPKSNFDLTTDGLIKLKQAGVNDDIVAAMLASKARSMPVQPTVTAPVAYAVNQNVGDPNDPMSPHTYGIYLFEERDGGRKMTQLTPNVSAQNRTGGLFTSSLTYGIGKVKIKANLPGRSAKLQIENTTPVFYFYLDVTSGGLNTMSGIPSTPNEFSLVRFNQRSDNREVTIGKANVFGAKGGLSDEYVVQFKSEDMGNGIFKITPGAPLTKGEYGFYLVNSGNSNAANAVGSKFFDFGVLMTP